MHFGTLTLLSDYQSLSEKTRVIFLTAPPVSDEQIRAHLGCVIFILSFSVICFWFTVHWTMLMRIHCFLNSDLLDMVRTNESCRIYSEACLEVCREMNLKAIDLWTATQQIDNWETVCLT
jgi:hypothetical protein